MSGQTIIIGAGLCGLTTAYLLQKAGHKVLLIEARKRCGGRIHTIHSNKGIPLEMGATWFGQKHQHLLGLLEELHIPYFPQFQGGKSLFEAMSFVAPQEFEVPDNTEPSYRIVGGTQQLIAQLANRIGTDNIILDTAIVSVVDKGTTLLLTDTKANSYVAERLISTLPPRLLLASIQFEPALPQQLYSLAETTHTWMESSIKFAVEYPSAFWKERGYSGAVFSHAGLANEIHDHSNFEQTGFALKGFMGGAAATMTKEERKKRIIAQFVKYFGKDAEEPFGYWERLWFEEKYTFSPSSNRILAHQNNGHPVFRESFWNGRFFVAGSETAPQFAGYMDGAVASANFVSKQLGIVPN